MEYCRGCAWKAYKCIAEQLEIVRTGILQMMERSFRLIENYIRRMELL